MNKEGHYRGDGMIWEPGEIPECHYCGIRADLVELRVMNVDDWVCCESTSCLMEAAEEILRGQVFFVTEEETVRDEDVLLGYLPNE